MRLVVVIATGSDTWGHLATNLCISIKANSPEQKVALIYTPSALSGIENYVDWFFDYGIRVSDKYEFAHEQAFYLKTQLYDIVTKSIPDATEIIYMDADTLMLPGKKVEDWFEEHKDRDFTACCNDYYQYSNKSRKRDDYTFWCDPEDYRGVVVVDDMIMPQINSSFIYFQKNANGEFHFGLVESLWSNAVSPFKPYKGVKPDEFCFNVASTLSGMIPHKRHYYPIFLQCFNEGVDESHILAYYKAFGFAGEQIIAPALIEMYNKYVKYYRKHFGIVEEFKFDADKVTFKDNNELPIRPVSVKTLYRRGELPNSDGGIFNPSSVMWAGSQWTIFRKEKGLNSKRQYAHDTSIAHLDGFGEIGIDGFGKGDRLEDYRLFVHDDEIYCSHSVITNNLKPSIKCEVAVSRITMSEIDGFTMPRLQLQYYVRPTCVQGSIEKNYAFFSDEADLYLIYSLKPYKLLKRVFGGWAEIDIKQPELNWMHKDQFICNSTHPILIDDHYLMFFHTKEKGQYFQGAVLINKDTKEIEYATPNSVPIKTCNEGMVPKLNYLSGALYLKEQNIIRLYIGEGDSHSVTNDYDATNLINVIKRFRV